MNKLENFDIEEPKESIGQPPFLYLALMLSIGILIWYVSLRWVSALKTEQKIVFFTIGVILFSLEALLAHLALRRIRLRAVKKNFSFFNTYSGISLNQRIKIGVILAPVLLIFGAGFTFMAVVVTRAIVSEMVKPLSSSSNFLAWIFIETVLLLGVLFFLYQFTNHVCWVITGNVLRFGKKR